MKFIFGFYMIWLYVLKFKKKMLDLYLYEIFWWLYICFFVKKIVVVLVIFVFFLWIIVVGLIDEIIEDNIDNCVEEGKFVVDVFIVVVVFVVMGFLYIIFKFFFSFFGRILI